MNRFHRWFCRTSLWKKALANEIIPWALKDVALGDDVLEVGPGPGMTTDILRERAPRLPFSRAAPLSRAEPGSGRRLDHRLHRHARAVECPALHQSRRATHPERRHIAEVLAASLHRVDQGHSQSA